MIVDDNPAMRSMIRRVLNAVPSDIIECADGNEAVLRYSAASPDWVLMDLQMPGLDGLEAMRRIRSVDSEARFVVVTAFDDPDLRAEALDLGAKGYVLKDDLPELNRIIR
ncbi:MAG TPA: response regulator transcription factor [Bacteroidota bacterium]|nr:response regulator transcription factor [Bacteroidota bacterium]